MAEKDWKATLEALMRKAEDPATTEAERETIVGRVAYLMAKYGIEEAMLNHQNQQQAPMIGFKLVIPNPYQKQKVTLAYGIMRALETEAVDLNGVLHIFGTQADIERVVMLYMSLTLQMATALAQAQSQKPSWEHGRTFNTSFVNAYVDTVVRRVRDFARRARADVKATTTGNGMELVLVEKRQLVLRKMKEFYPRTRMVHSSSASNSSSGRSAGRDAGMRADIGGTRLSGGRNAIGR